MTTVDWSKPIEAVHTDGRVVAVTLAQTDGCTDGTYCRRVEPHPEEGRHWFNEDGSHSRVAWSIRNVQPAATSDEATTRALALVERMAADWTYTSDGRSFSAEARAIQALRTPPVDPRLDLVVRSLVGNGVSKPVALLFARDVLKALDAAS